MKQYLFIGFFLILSLMGFEREVFSDTIDFYHVYYNNKVIDQFNQFNTVFNKTIMIDTTIIKMKDSLKVIYWDDTPCCDCECFLSIIKRDNYTNGYTISHMGVGNSFKISLFDLLKFSRKFNIYDYEILYYVDEYNSNISTLFYLKLKWQWIILWKDKLIRYEVILYLNKKYKHDFQYFYLKF